MLERDETPEPWSTRVNPQYGFTFKTDPTEQERKNNYMLYVSGYPWIFRAPDPNGDIVLFCAFAAAGKRTLATSSPTTTI